MKNMNDLFGQYEKSTVGRSSITPIKQEDIQNLLKDQIGKAYGVWSKYSNEQWYKEVSLKGDIQNCFIDCSAGHMDLTQHTSPRSFIEKLMQFKHYPAELFLIEKERETYNRLVINFHQLNGQNNNYFPRVRILNEDMRDFLAELKPNKYRFGLLYFDPNGFKRCEYDAIIKFLSENPRMDLIYNINATQIVRCKGVAEGNSDKATFFNGYKGLDLSRIISNINRYKKVIYLRNNFHRRVQCVKHTTQFILLFATNNNGFVIPSKYGFVPLNTSDGQSLITKYNYLHEQ